MPNGKQMWLKMKNGDVGAQNGYWVPCINSEWDVVLASKQNKACGEVDTESSSGKEKSGCSIENSFSINDAVYCSTEV